MSHQFSLSRQRRFIVAFLLIVVAGGLGRRPIAVEAQANPQPVSIFYRVNLNGVWSSPVSNGATAGTPDNARHVLAVDFQLGTGSGGGRLRCTAHVSNVGWLPEMDMIQPCGDLRDPSRFRLEAVILRLVDMPGYTLRYRCWAQGLEWLAYQTDGGVCGTTGQSRRLENIEVSIVPPPLTTGIRIATEQGGPAVATITQDTADLRLPAPTAKPRYFATVPQGVQAQLWTGINFTGGCATLLQGSSQLPFAPRSARLGSVCPAPAPDAQQLAEALLYDGPRQTGNRLPLRGDIAQLPPQWDNKPLSFSIPPGQRAALYDAPNYGGACVDVTGNPNTLGTGEVNQLDPWRSGGGPSSVAPGLPCGQQVRPQAAILFDGENFSGPFLRVTGEIADLAQLRYEQRASSIRLRPGVVAVALYSLPNFAGVCETVLRDTRRLAELSIGDNRVWSIRVNATCSEPEVPANRAPIILDVKVITGSTAQCETGYTRRTFNISQGNGSGNHTYLCLRHGAFRSGATFVYTLTPITTARLANQDHLNLVRSSCERDSFYSTIQVDYNQGVPDAAGYFCLRTATDTRGGPGFNTGGAPLRDLDFVFEPDFFKSRDNDHIDSLCAAKFAIGTNVTNFDLVAGGFGSFFRNADPHLCSAYADPDPTLIGVPTIAAPKEQVQAGELLTLTVTWEVPEPLVWRDLDTIDLRIGDWHGDLLRVRFDEAANTLSLFDDATSTYQGGVVVGTGGLLATPFALLNVGESRVQGSGAQGRMVTLTLALRFTEAAQGRAALISLLARSDRGDEQLADERTLVVVGPFAEAEAVTDPVGP